MNRCYTLLWRKIWTNPVLCEPGRKFSRLEAWLHIIYVLAAEMDNEGGGLKLGEFVASIRFLARTFNGRRAELNDDFVSPVLAAASQSTPYHLFWDDADKLKLTDFKTEELFDLVDSLYRRNHGLTVTSNYSMRDLIERERMHPAIVRRIDDMCRAIKL